MRGTVEWSHDPCGEVHRRVFGRLSVIRAVFEFADESDAWEADAPA